MEVCVQYVWQRHADRPLLPLGREATHLPFCWVVRPQTLYHGGRRNRGRGKRRRRRKRSGERTNKGMMYLRELELQQIIFIQEVGRGYTTLTIYTVLIISHDSINKREPTTNTHSWNLKIELYETPFIYTFCYGRPLGRVPGGKKASDRQTIHLSWSFVWNKCFIL